MFNLEKIVRKNILDLKPYSSARDEFVSKEGIFLNANENPFGELNRYPDSYQRVLKQKLGKLKSVPIANIFIGNGSDEIIDLTFRIFCKPGKDNVVICPPTYGMYEVSANINDILIQKIELRQQTFQLNTDKIIAAINENTKLIFVCCPNNPTGNGVKWADIKKIATTFKGILVVDEAYIDFASYRSLSHEFQNYPNLLIMQTFSKAWGLAAARVGIAYADTKIVSLLNKIKPPYNVSELNQQAAIKALGNYSEFKKNKEIILKEKVLLINKLQLLHKVKKIYPSEANFLLVEVENADKIYKKFMKKGIVTRNRTHMIKNCIRITIGSPGENQKLIEAFNQL